MSTSFVEYRGRGFWSFDGYLEHALTLLADQIGDSPNDEWLAELRDHWRAQSSGVFSGWIHPNLDEYLTSEQRHEQVLSLLRKVLSHTQLQREARETLELFEALLCGHLTTDASSPLDYMVSGPHPYKWAVGPDKSSD
jgi:hypothetical protein